jgi:hypothetical protein
MAWIRQEIDEKRVSELLKEDLLETGLYAILRNGETLIRGLVTQLEPVFSVLDCIKTVN